jgi:ubiquinone/menaquinone biosynthesis C-methylase UbiE
MPVSESKRDVREFWEHEVCGTRYGPDTDRDRKHYFDLIERTRYEQDYMLRQFADFEGSCGKRVLEVGLGAGTDFIQWLRSGAVAHGRDLTDASVALVKERVALEGFTADVQRGDAEQLDFPDNFFDIYYSWGVLHHAPNTERTIAEAYRVLKPGGVLRIMLYHYPSVGTLLVWLLFGPLKLRFRSIRQCCADHIESPGTKVYTVKQARVMIGSYFRIEPIEIRTFLGSGDLLTQKLSGRYQGGFWTFVQWIFPRWFVKNILGHRFGTVMTIQVVK